MDTRSLEHIKSLFFAILLSLSLLLDFGQVSISHSAYHKGSTYHVSAIFNIMGGNIPETFIRIGTIPGVNTMWV